MSFNLMSVDLMSVIQMSVDQIFVNQMSIIRDSGLAYYIMTQITLVDIFVIFAQTVGFKDTMRMGSLSAFIKTLNQYL